jgi:hypothetical protein
MGLDCRYFGTSDHRVWKQSDAGCKRNVNAHELDNIMMLRLVKSRGIYRCNNAG